MTRRPNPATVTMAMSATMATARCRRIPRLLCAAVRFPYGTRPSCEPIVERRPRPGERVRTDHRDEEPGDDAAPRHPHRNLPDIQSVEQEIEEHERRIRYERVRSGARE